ncbi:hypothetical protein [Sphaerisporangium dianthi]|uniref:Uncharacterized protein n=1 Tax=Sphaerisporangium dianthi TaxID=1436120 RepID=A0ABV9CUD3_9ACTN
MNTDLDRLVASIAPSPGPGLTPGALELLDEITTGTACDSDAVTAVQQRGRLRWHRRLRVLAPLAVAIVLASWFLPDAAGLGPRPASAALDITREGGDYIVTVKDLFADPERYEREFRAVHLNVRLSLEPVTPSLEGVIMTLSNEITALEAPGCGFPRRWQGCQIGLKVPVGYQDRANVVLGREARAGEEYKVRATLAADGEPLHCTPFVNKHVPVVVRMLKERGVPRVEFVTYHGLVPSAADSWYVHDGVMSRPGTALLLVDVAPHPDPLLNLRNHCPGRS